MRCFIRKLYNFGMFHEFKFDYAMNKTQINAEPNIDLSLFNKHSNNERFSNILNDLKEKKVHSEIVSMKTLTVSHENMDFQNVQGEACEIEKAVSLSDGKNYLSWDFLGSLDVVSMEPNRKECTGELERILVDDMLNILLGFDGKYIKANVIKDTKETRTFRVSYHIQPPLLTLVQRLLPAASDYSQVARFIEESVALNSGRVNQALAAVFSEEVLRYTNHVVSLEEEEGLDLNTIWSSLQDDAGKLRIMEQICRLIVRENARGGATLTVLHNCTSNCLSDTEAQNVCTHWTRLASVPFFDSLKKWLSTGEIYDPYDEFMIKEKANGEGGDWDQQHQLRPKYTPTFLENMAQTILHSGIYISCVRKSIGPVHLDSVPGLSEMRYEVIDFAYQDVIKKAHDYANGLLKTVLDSDDFAMLGLEFAKSLFTIQYGDMFYNIFDKCKDGLTNNATKTNFNRIHNSILKSILESTIGRSDFSSEIEVVLERASLSCQISDLLNVSVPSDRHDAQTILEAMTLTFKTTWPLKVVLDSKTMKSYQMIFRHMFFVKYVYMRLTTTKFGREVPAKLHSLKNAMTVFVQTCLSFMALDTIETMWHKFKNNYKSYRNVLDLIKSHKKYIYNVLTGCMLTSSQTYQQLRHALDVCLEFLKNPKPEFESDFEESLLTLIDLSRTETRWSAFCGTLIPIFTNFEKISILNKDLLSSIGDTPSFTSVERSLLRIVM